MELWISWSALRTHEACTMATKLRRERKGAKTVDIRNFFPGTVTDRVSRDWLLSDDPQPGQMEQMVGDLFDKILADEEQKGQQVIWRDRQDRDRVIADCREAVIRLEKDLTRLVLPFEYQPDYKFRVPINLPHPRGGKATVILNGAMDILVRDRRGNLGIWDVKHTRDDSYWRKTTGQINFYGLVTLLQYDRLPKISGLLQPLCKEPVKKIAVRQEDVSYILQRITAMARDVWSEDYKLAATSEPCHYCQYKHACPKFTPTRLANGTRVVSLMNPRA